MIVAHATQKWISPSAQVHGKFPSSEARRGPLTLRPPSPFRSSEVCFHGDESSISPAKSAGPTLGEIFFVSSPSLRAPGDACRRAALGITSLAGLRNGGCPVGQCLCADDH